MHLKARKEKRETWIRNSIYPTMKQWILQISYKSYAMMALASTECSLGWPQIIQFKLDLIYLCFLKRTRKNWKLKPENTGHNIQLFSYCIINEAFSCRCRPFCLQIFYLCFIVYSIEYFFTKEFRAKSCEFYNRFYHSCLVSIFLWLRWMFVLCVSNGKKQWTNISHNRKSIAKEFS